MGESRGFEGPDPETTVRTPHWLWPRGPGAMPPHGTPDPTTAVAPHPHPAGHRRAERVGLRRGLPLSLALLSFLLRPRPSRGHPCAPSFVLCVLGPPRALTPRAHPALPGPRTLLTAVPHLSLVPCPPPPPVRPSPGCHGSGPGAGSCFLRAGCREGGLGVVASPSSGFLFPVFIWPG